jgi:predicted acyl esterase
MICVSNNHRIMDGLFELELNLQYLDYQSILQKYLEPPLLACASWSTQGLHNRGSFEGFKQASSEDKWLYIHYRIDPLLHK